MRVVGEEMKKDDICLINGEKHLFIYLTIFSHSKEMREKIIKSNIRKNTKDLKTAGFEIIGKSIQGFDDIYSENYLVNIDLTLKEINQDK